MIRKLTSSKTISPVLTTVKSNTKTEGSSEASEAPLTKEQELNKKLDLPLDANPEDRANAIYEISVREQNKKLDLPLNATAEDRANKVKGTS